MLSYLTATGQPVFEPAVSLHVFKMKNTVSSVEEISEGHFNLRVVSCTVPSRVREVPVCL